MPIDMPAQPPAPIVQRVADHLVFPEGPVWVPGQGLLFSDVHGKLICRVKPGGGWEKWFDAGIKTNGLILDKTGTKIYACCHSELQLLEIDVATRKHRILADQCDGRPFLNVNDVAVDAKGHVFFTDPNFPGTKGVRQGVYRWNPTDNATTIAAEIGPQPNGLVVSPDQKYLYVGLSGEHTIRRFNLASDGTLTGGDVWVKLDPGATPDGMTIDARGRLYQSQYGNGRVDVFSPEGKLLLKIQVSKKCATNCEFEPGTNDRILYVTTAEDPDNKGGAVYRVELPELP